MPKTRCIHEVLRCSSAPTRKPQESVKSRDSFLPCAILSDHPNSSTLLFHTHLPVHYLNPHSKHSTMAAQVQLSASHHTCTHSFNISTLTQNTHPEHHSPTFQSLHSPITTPSQLLPVALCLSNPTPSSLSTHISYSA